MVPIRPRCVAIVFVKILAGRFPQEFDQTPMASPIDEVTRRLRDLAARSPLADLEQNVRAAVTQGLSRLDLVTREEFDAQSRVLAKTREKLAALESRVAELEARLNSGAE